LYFNNIDIFNYHQGAFIMAPTTTIARGSEWSDNISNAGLGALAYNTEGYSEDQISEMQTWIRNRFHELCEEEGYPEIAWKTGTSEVYGDYERYQAGEYDDIDLDALRERAFEELPYDDWSEEPQEVQTITANDKDITTFEGLSELFEMAETSGSELSISAHEEGYTHVIVEMDGAEIVEAWTTETTDGYYRNTEPNIQSIIKVGTGSVSCNCDACLNGDNPKEWADDREFWPDYEDQVNTFLKDYLNKLNNEADCSL
jgi:ATP-dependent Clp protease adapter protein ClpS